MANSTAFARKQREFFLKFRHFLSQRKRLPAEDQASTHGAVTGRVVEETVFFNITSKWLILGGFGAQESRRKR